MKKLLLLIAFCSVVNLLFGNTKDTLEILTLESNINGSIYQLYLSTPTNYNSQRKYPVILLLEANYYHRTFVNLYDSIHSMDYDDHIIVGIGSVPGPFHDNSYIRDFTPHAMEGFPNAGMAEAFRQVLETELIPTLCHNYAVDESRVSIVGHHYSALFLVWTLNQDAPKFANYVICSPVLAFSENLYNLNLDDKAETGIYLSSGTSKIKLVKNPKVNQSRFTTLKTEFENHAAKLNSLQISNFSSMLRYDDLYKGFSEGIAFIFENRHNRGEWECPLLSNSKNEIDRTDIIIEKLTDPNTSRQYEILIYMPEENPSGILPLTLILDSDFNFTELLHSAKKAMRNGGLPESAMVGIGYGTTIIGRGNNRGLDFLPHKLKNIESGNAENFYKMIETQLLPMLELYSVSWSNTTIVGHSFGGLFLTYLLTKDTIPFTNLIISSPAIWRDKAVLRKLKESRKHIDVNGFVASGIIDDNDKDTMKLSRALKNKSMNNLETVYYPNDNHLTVISKAFIDGLKFFNR